MDPLTGLDLQWMKNYQGQIGLVPSRMLQYISLPFGTRTLLLLKEGVKLDIAFTKRELFNQNGHEHFDDMTPVLVMKQYINEDGQTAGTNHVVDVDLNRARGVEDSVLERPFARSWDVLINPERLADTFEHNLRYNGYSDANYNTRRLWYNANPVSPGEKAAEDAETRPAIKLNVRKLPRGLRPGKKPLPSPYDWKQ